MDESKNIKKQHEELKKINDYGIKKINSIEGMKENFIKSLNFTKRSHEK